MAEPAEQVGAGTVSTSETDNADTPVSVSGKEDLTSDSGGGEKEVKVEVLSHGEIMHVVKDTVAGLIATDPLLKDLHPYVTLEEVNSMIALEYGQAMVVNIQRADNEIMPIVVKQDASVLDLKHGIKRFLTLHLSRKGEGHVPISWRYVWKHHWLYFDGEKLTDDNKKLKDYGIRNRDKVTFMKRLQER
ncbi:U11/U12 small nuclear ribonucleoprotein 25 kDa protein-like isoform X2 [Babylonia areolata]|uniref:U11/U12 small nuclear ribonucleoprotein 25 kDa protein-like isoform X2 n=1 Tax=Babylonia areolata TaxID=304850 RepID=UPI003FD4C475